MLVRWPRKLFADVTCSKVGKSLRSVMSVIGQSYRRCNGVGPHTRRCPRNGRLSTPDCAGLACGEAPTRPERAYRIFLLFPRLLASYIKKVNSMDGCPGKGFFFLVIVVHLGLVFRPHRLLPCMHAFWGFQVLLTKHQTSDRRLLLTSRAKKRKKEKRGHRKHVLIFPMPTF